LGKIINEYIDKLSTYKDFVDKNGGGERYVDAQVEYGMLVETTITADIISATVTIG
jgi:hypothetical protein